MFRKGSRRNFRRRKSESSEEEDEPAAGRQRTAACSAAARRDRSRGLACASKPAPVPSSPAEACGTSPSSASESGNEEAAAETRDELKMTAQKQAEKGTGGTTVHDKHLLSFVCDREADEEEFKVKKTGNTILFAPQWKKKKQNNTEEDKVIAKVDVEVRQDFFLTKTQKENSLEKETVDSHTESEDEIISEVDESNTSGVGQYKTQSGEIPDARFIKAARRKRQLARAQVDFIPLHSLARDDTSVPDEELLTSDDELDDNEKRIHFTKALKTQRQKMAEEIGVDESENGSIKSGGEDDDDDQLLWEQQQTKRVKVFSPQFTEMVSRPNTLIVNRMLDNLKKLPPVNLETVKKRLVNRLESLQEVHHSHHREQEKIQETAESSRSTIEHLEAVSDSGIRYRFYQEMRTFVKNLVNCFNEKVHLINELEYEMHQLLQDQARKLLQRRQDDIQDESSDIWQLSNKVDIDKDSVKTKQQRTEKREARRVHREHLRMVAGKEADHHKGMSSDEEVSPGDISEFHAKEDKVDIDKDSVKTKQQRTEKREARRVHREHLRMVAGKEADHHKGMSSDEEVSPGDISEFHAKEDHILKEARKIFNDVQEDFCSVDRIFDKFRLWREKFPDSYYDAYIGFCLQKILNPLIRLQLISWNPLKQDCLHLLEMPWISALEEYCHLEDEEFKKKDNSDAALLLTVIEKTVIPKIEGFVIHVWDPLSSSQTKCLVQTFRKLKEEYNVFGSEQSKATQALKKSIVMRITLSVEEDIFIPLYPKSVLEDRTSVHSQFQERQFWSAVKLLGNILQWDGLLPDETLQDLSLDKLLNRYILLIFQTSPPHSRNMEKCEKIIDCFPRRWFENLQGRSSLPQLENLCKYLLQFIRRIYENGATTQDEDNTGRESIKEMLKMLAMIHALEQTEAIINECKLEDLEWIFQGN